MDGLILRGETVAITAQNLVEFQALATRPIEANGLGLTTTEANEQARDTEELLTLVSVLAATVLANAHRAESAASSASNCRYSAPTASGRV